MVVITIVRSVLGIDVVSSGRGRVCWIR